MIIAVLSIYLNLNDTKKKKEKKTMKINRIHFDFHKLLSTQ